MKKRYERYLNKKKDMKSQERNSVKCMRRYEVCTRIYFFEGRMCTNSISRCSCGKKHKYEMGATLLACEVW
jgi:hypothetical protein